MQTLKLFYYLFIMLIPTLQALVCGSTKIFTWIFFFFTILLLTLNRSSKIFFSKSEFYFIFLVIALNAFYTFVLERHLVFLDYSYVIILSIFLAKILGEYFSMDELISFVSKIYMIVMVLLVFEYILYLLGFQVVISNLLECKIPNISQYITLSNNFSNMLGISVRGLNSPFMGAQVASQLSAISFLWFIIIWSGDRNKYSHFLYWAILSLILLILSPSATILVALFITCFLIFLGYVNCTKLNYFVSLKFLFLTFLASIVIVSLAFAFAFSSYSGAFDVLISLVLEQINIFIGIDFMQLLFGVRVGDLSYYVDGGPGEIGLLSQMLRVGVIGVLIFFIYILYIFIPFIKIYKSVFIQKQYYILASIATLLVYILSNFHYAVIFRLGLIELFILHISLVLVFSKNNKFKFSD